MLERRDGHTPFWGWGEYERVPVPICGSAKVERVPQISEGIGS